MGEPFPGTPPSGRPLEDRLDSWKEIAAYLNRDVTTVQRWEKREGMPTSRQTGREVVLERVQERSDVVLLDLPRP